MSTSGWDWREWPCITPIPAAPSSCPILHPSCRPILCGPSCPHAWGTNLGLCHHCKQPQLRGWAHEQLCWYNAGRGLKRGEGTTEKSGGFGALAWACLRCHRKLQQQILASASHVKQLSCFIIAFFIIRYFYCWESSGIFETFTVICYGAVTLIPFKIQFCICKSCCFWLSSIEKGLYSKYNQPEYTWIGSSYAWGIYTCLS